MLASSFLINIVRIKTTYNNMLAISFLVIVVRIKIDVSESIYPETNNKIILLVLCERECGIEGKTYFNQLLKRDAYYK